MFESGSLNQNKAEANAAWARERFGVAEHVLLMHQGSYVSPATLPDIPMFRRFSALDRLRPIADQLAAEKARLKAETGGEVYDTEELRDLFEVKGFAAPLVVVKRKSDGQVGSLEFQHAPRLYFNWQPDRP